MVDPSGWWYGKNRYGEVGLFPGTYVEKMAENTASVTSAHSRLSHSATSTNSSDASWSASRKKQDHVIGNRLKSDPPKQQPSQIRRSRSFVPPVHDEESETQRRAHAKIVQETRRLTHKIGDLTKNEEKPLPALDEISIIENDIIANNF